ERRHPAGIDHRRPLAGSGLVWFSIIPLLLSTTCLLAASTTALEKAKSNIQNVRLQITLFDHDKAQDDRSIDLSVTEDVDANAEALMNSMQAARILDALAADGFFERAKEMNNEKWDPPPQPFYVIWLRFDDTSGIYEFPKADAGLTELFVRI